MGFRVGLTGGVASGKTTISQLFAELGVDIIDADIIARHLLSQGTDCYHQVLEQFGRDAVRDDGEIDRTYLRQLIFSDNAAKQQLEAILHPLVRQQMLDAAEHSSSDYCILVVPLLIEANMQDLVDRIVIIDLPENTQIERLMRRDQSSLQQATNMLSNQCTRQQRLQVADDIIDNSGDREQLTQQVHHLHQLYLNQVHLRR